MTTLTDSEYCSPQWEQNGNRSYSGAHDRCLACKKPITSEKTNTVRLLTDGRVTLFEGELPDSLDQGWHEVGPDCYRKITGLLAKKADI